jgi:hypothetical protein
MQPKSTDYISVVGVPTAKKLPSEIPPLSVDVGRNAYERTWKIVGMPETDAEAEAEQEQEQESESASEHSPADGFNVGDVVHDRDSDEDDPTSAYVATLPDATAEEWVAHDETTVAEDNPEYPADARVVVVVFGNTVDYQLPDWDRISPLSPSEIEEAGGRSYSFPVPRLVRDHLSPNISAPDTPEPDENGPDSAGDEAESEEADQSEEAEKFEPEGESTAEPTAAIVALQRYLESDGMQAEITDDGQAVRATKEGESYRVNVEGVLEGDGPHRSHLEETVEKLRAAL